MAMSTPPVEQRPRLAQESYHSPPLLVHAPNDSRRPLCPREFTRADYGKPRKCELALANDQARVVVSLAAAREGGR